MLNLSRLSSIGEALENSLQIYKTNVALIEANRHRENGRWTYQQFSEQSDRLGALLQDLKLAPKQRCVIAMQNQSKWLFSATGVLRAGAVVVPLDYKLKPAQLLRLLTHSGSNFAIVEYPIWQALQRFDEKAWAGCVVLVTEAPASEQLAGAIRWETPCDTVLQPARVQREDLACIVYSSGTSGREKGCLLTHDNYLEQAEALGRVFPASESDRFFSLLPTNHAIDFMSGYLLPLFFGASIVHQRTLRPEFLASTVKKYQVTQMALVPSLLKSMKERIETRLKALPEWQQQVVQGLTGLNSWATARGPNPRLSRWLLKPIVEAFGGELRTIFAGGSFVDRSLVEFFYPFGISVAIGYGLTEACTVVSVNDLKPCRGDTVGKPLVGVEVEIRRTSSSQAIQSEEGPFAPGEVWVRGKTVMLGYLNDPELTKETLVDGWLRTGDVGCFDASGHLRLLGRTKNMVVTPGGKNVYPEEVEMELGTLPDCEAFCVVPATGLSIRNERLVGIIQCTTGKRPTEQMRTELHRRNLSLAVHKRLMGYVVFEQEFPRTASRKLKRTELAATLKAIEELEILTLEN